MTISQTSLMRLLNPLNMKTTEKNPCKTREIICTLTHKKKGDNLYINMSEQGR